MSDNPLWTAEAARLAAQRELEESRARMYAAQKKYSLAHDAYLAAMETHRNAQPAYSTPNTPGEPRHTTGR